MTIVHTMAAVLGQIHCCHRPIQPSSGQQTYIPAVSTAGRSCRSHRRSFTQYRKLHNSQVHSGRKERIIFGHIQQLLKILLISTNGSSNLWRLHDEIQANVRSLENLGVDGTTNGLKLGRHSATIMAVVRKGSI